MNRDSYFMERNLFWESNIRISGYEVSRFFMDHEITFFGFCFDPDESTLHERDLFY